MDTLFRKIERRLAFKLVNVLPDEIYLKLLFHGRVGYWPNLHNPKTFNEKLQWLKLNDKHPEYTKMVDKVDAKEYVARIIGKKYVIPTLGVWDNVEEIDWKSLPDKFVIKCAGDSGGIVICKNKETLDIESARKILKAGWKSNYYNYYKEYPYNDVKPRIIAEKYMVDESGYELKDYKFFCFDGIPKFLKVDFDRQINHRANYYNTDWNILPFYEVCYPKDEEKNISKPINFDEMIEVAKALSKDIPFVRIDLYNVNGKIYFGEMTFFPATGMGRIEPLEWDYKIGDYLRIPINKNK